MKHDPVASGKRKPVNLSIDTGVVAAARAAGINLSQVSESALRHAARVADGQRWLEEHGDAIAGMNRWTAEHGLPLERNIAHSDGAIRCPCAARRDARR